MDYAKIYADFIRSRKEAEGQLQGYVERHHIVPRSLGGSDDRENLVRLTPEDHFFAHLLLAKIHGGKMRAALYCMLLITEQHWGRRAHSRGRYGLAKRMAVPALAERWRGEKNPLFNDTRFEWVNYRTGATEVATLFEMHSKHGASRASWTSVATGDRPSIKGWLLADRLANHRRSEKGQVFEFVHRDGRGFVGTQKDFCDHTGLSDASSFRVVHKRSVTRCGWRLCGVMDRSFNCPRDGSRSGPRAKIYTLKKNGALLVGDRVDLADALASTPARVSAALTAITSGRMRAYKGWQLLKAE